MEENTRASEKAKYFDLFERLLDSVFLLDPQSLAILDTNSAAERLMATDHQHIVNHLVTEWIDQTDLDALQKAFRIANRRYYPHTLELKWKGPDQKVIQMEAVICSLQLSDEVKTIQMILKDITKQVEAEKKEQEYLKSLEVLNEKLEELSTTDEMTKLPNFRQFKKTLEAEHVRASRYGTPYSIIFCDVDNFKHYNDRNGHPAGDAFLRQLGDIFKKCCRAVDLPARYGGEEFAFLCPETSEADALILAERLRAAVQAYPFPHAEAQPLGKASISIGVSSFRSSEQTAADVLKVADMAVYHSKKSGRNRVTSGLQLAEQDLKKAA